MRTLRISASALALAVGLAAPGVAAAQAQPQTAAPDAAPPAPADDQAAASGDIVVTGVRASLPLLPDLLRIRGAGDPGARSHQRLDPRRLAAAPLQPVQPWWR